MNFTTQHKIKLLLLGVFILVFIIALFVLINLLYPDSRKDVYGNRLDGINSNKVSNQTITQIKDKISTTGLVENIEYLLKGRLISFIIKVKSDIKVDESKKVVETINELLEDNIKSFYDIEVIILENKDESKNYPIFAYKHKTSEKFVWTNN